MLTKPLVENHFCDRVIWDSFKKGDKDAFATLYYRYFRVLIQNCCRYSNDKNLIEDCIHDLFLEIWINKLNLATPESVKGYLLCSTQRKIVNHIRKNRNLQNKVCITVQPDVAQSIEEQIISEQIKLESNRNIKKALSTLSKRQKEAVYFRYYDNLSYSEISTKMDISTDSVYNLVSKALDNIQKCVQGKSKTLKTYLN